MSDKTTSHDRPVKTTILLGERIEKNPDDPKDYGWITLYDSRKETPKQAEMTLLGKKSVIFFPGDGENTERGANGCCGAVEKMLTEAGVSKKDMPHLYGLAYQRKGLDKHRKQVLTQLGQAPQGVEYSPSTKSAPEQPYFNHFLMNIFYL